MTQQENSFLNEKKEIKFNFYNYEKNLKSTKHDFSWKYNQMSLCWV